MLPEASNNEGQPNEEQNHAFRFANTATLVRVFLSALALQTLLLLTGTAHSLSTLLTIGLTLLGFALAIRGFRNLFGKTIWRLRNRLYVTYVFIGVVPLVLLLMLSAAGIWIVVGQVAVYLISSEMERGASLLAVPAETISRTDFDDLPATVAQLSKRFRARMSDFEVLVSDGREFRYPPNNSLVELQDVGDYTGFVRLNGRIYLWHSRRSEDGRRVIVATGLTRRVMERLAPALGTVTLVEEREQLRSHPAGKLPLPYNALDFAITWVNPLQVKPDEKPGSTSLLVETRPSAVLSAVFGTKLDTGQIAFVGFVIVASLLFATELISLVIGISLTRTITGTVHEIYAGTQKIATGDFGYRIPVKGTDQLAELGNSFNNMSAQIEQLIVVAKEKERMESELGIAREVQNQLFPRSAPKMGTVQLTGVCRPARSVSGDYYDYLCLPNGSLAFALGDVAGKGISAALLMASIQSIMRTQLAAGLPLSAAAGSGTSRAHHSTSGVVAQLNRQLYANTSPEKYATFFFGVYDEAARLMTYTNAGHLPPLLLHNGEVQPLAVTGTVVGAFPNVTYEEQSVRIVSGDLLVAYTDGITEPENAYGEEFGEQRLADTLLKFQNSEPAEISAKVMEAVCEWSSAPELPDDMTVVIVQGIR